MDRYNSLNDVEIIGHRVPDGRLYCLSCFGDIQPHEREGATPIPATTDIIDADLECCACDIWLLSDENR